MPRRTLSHTIISCDLFFNPALLTTCTYFIPLKTSCCTRNLAFMRNTEPSLIVKGWFLSSSSAFGFSKSKIMSGRPSTSRPRERITTRRGSLGSAMGVPEPIPSDSFHFRRDSSFWSSCWYSSMVLGKVLVWEEVNMEWPETRGRPRTSSPQLRIPRFSRAQDHRREVLLTWWWCFLCEKGCYKMFYERWVFAQGGGVKKVSCFRCNLFLWEDPHHARAFTAFEEMAIGTDK